jgi:hypothetical protein
MTSRIERAGHAARFAPPFVAAIAGCVSMPDPPPPPEDLSALAEQYEHPRGVVRVDLVERLLVEGRRRAELGGALDRLHFVRSLVVDTSSGIEERGNTREYLLQGSITATIPCPGDGPEPTADGDVNGWVRVQLGVEDSRLRRGFSGAVERCRLRVVATRTLEQRILVDATVAGDLGADLGIGNTTPAAILLKLSDVVATAFSSAGTVDLSQHEYHFRLTDDDALEVLFDPASVGLPDVGSVVFAAKIDGSFALRESRGEWVCGGGGGPCVLR